MASSSTSTVYFTTGSPGVIYTVQEDVSASDSMVVTAAFLALCLVFTALMVWFINK